MRKFPLWAGAFAAAVAAVVAACLLFNSHTKTADVTSPLPALVAQKTHVLLGWKPLLGQEFTLHFPAGDEVYALVLCEFDSYVLTCNGALLAVYDGSRGYERANIVPLPQRADGSCALRLTMPVMADRNRILVCTLAQAELYRSWSDGANMLTIGVYLLIIFYSLTLFYQKRSERYLLYIVILSVVALLSAFSNSTIAVEGIHNIDQPVRYFRITFCTALCFLLMDVRPGGKWHYLYSWQGVLCFTALLYVFPLLKLERITDELSYLLIIPAGLACASGCARKVPCALPFMLCVAAREALRIYYRLINADVIPGAPFFSYFYMPQLSSIIFVLGCMLVINERFGRKFRQTDELAAQLEEANATLDLKVEQRTQELQRANELLISEQERKRNIMTNLFHDLRTPIFSAQGSAERIRAADEASEQKLAVLKDRLDFLEHLSEELFLAAKLDEGQVKFEQYRVRIDDFFPSVAEGFATLAEKKGVRFARKCQCGLLVTGDSYRLRQALGNLLSNAVKYTPPGGEVCVSVQRQGGFAVFTVSDTGPGIAQSDLPHIFERYYQGSLSRGPESAGLGLSITKAIVDAHGGELSATSQIGRGSAFVLRLPLEEE